ncbi:MAG: glycosyltransferase family 4 protein [Pseudomonadota bacterium]
MSAMKIALINTFYPPYNFGGDGVYVRRFAHALARLGCDVRVLHDAETYKALAPKPLGDLTPPEEPPGVSVTRLESELGPLSTLITHQTGRPVAHAAALKEFFSESFDVTHFHNVSAVGGPGILSMGSGVRLYTAHEHWLVCPTHILWRHNRELCDRRECIKCQAVYRRPPQLWRYSDYLKRQTAHIDAFIALSRSSAENHRRFGFEPEIRVMPSFLPDAHPSTTRILSEKPFALFVGRLEKLKGLQDVIPAFKARPNLDLLIIGDGEFRGELETLAGGAPNIRFLGKRSPEALEDYYRGAAAVILPSVCYEVFPLVALEAFRAGAPIVARNIGPFPEIAEISGAGILFDRPEEAASAVERLAADPKLRQEMGAQGRRAFETHWSERVALSAYFNLIAEIAARKGARNTVEMADLLASKLANSH